MANLIKLYGLEETARSLARTNPDGSKGVKLRKSYKNHIQDLPGKHNIPGAKPIPNGLLDPLLEKTPDIIKPLDPDMVKKAMNFDKTPLNGIPGFNTADLAINDQQSFMRRDDGSDNDDDKRSKRKKKNQSNGGDSKRQHI